MFELILFIYKCTVPCSHNETSISMFLEYTFDNILTTGYTSESEISTPGPSRYCISCYASTGTFLDIPNKINHNLWGS